jgi:hypothetical protein
MIFSGSKSEKNKLSKRQGRQGKKLNFGVKSIQAAQKMIKYQNKPNADEINDRGTTYDRKT